MDQILFSSRLIRFLGTGLLNTAFGYSIYASLVFSGVPYLAALLAATVLGIIFNYFSFGRIVFQGHGGWVVFGKFIAAYVLVYGVNALLLTALTGFFCLNPYAAQVICIPVSVALSWLLMTYWVYKEE
jgi:putative flippase GtrA